MGPDLRIFTDEDLEELLDNAKKVLRVTYSSIDGYSKMEVPVNRLMHISELQEKILAYQKELERRGRLGARKAPRRRGPTEVFLSHAHQDAGYALELARGLEQDGTSVFHSGGSIGTSESFVERINTALASCHAGVVVWSGAAAASKWVENEVNALTIRRNQGEVSVQVVLVEPMVVPPLLREVQAIDDLGKREPGRVAGEIYQSLRLRTPLD